MSYFNNLCSYLSTRYRSLEDYYNNLQSEEEKKDFVKKTQSLVYGGAENGQNDGGGQEFADLYSVSYVQDLYLLRYMYAYAYEYREMFSRLLSEHDLPKVVNVLSIGCGNGIDYWALREALSINEIGEKYVKYTGIDEINWGEQWNKRNGSYPMSPRDYEYAKYIVEGAVQYIENVGTLPYNVIVFPKCIGEFSEDEFTNICEALRTKEYKFKIEEREYNTKKVHFLISLRKVNGISLTDRNRCMQLKEAMENNHFELSDPMTAENFYMEDDLPIKERDRGFYYPPDVAESMERMSERIWEFIQGLEDDEIVQLLGDDEITQGSEEERNKKIKNRIERTYTPMTRTKYICNTIMTFQRCQE